MPLHNYMLAWGVFIFFVCGPCPPRANIRRRETIRNAAVDDLYEGEMARIGKQVEGLGLDAGRVHRRPLDVVLGELGVGRRLGLFGNALAGRGAVDGLLRPDHIGHSGVR